MKILAIESTCDETGAAIVQIADHLGGGHAATIPGDLLQIAPVMVLSNVVASSSEMHEKYGGIVPEVAAREQVKVITSVVKEAMQGIDKEEIDAVAVSVGPGLIGSLLIGVETAKTLALAWNKPLIPVNHLRGHLMANLIVGHTSGESLRATHRGVTLPTAQLPAVGLLVSGGHTELVKMKSINDWEWIGGTRDDAAGECFDKCARLLDLGYPGGPAIESAAMNVALHLGGIPSGYPPRSNAIPGGKLPRPMIHEDSLEMSFSGLKAAVAKLVNSHACRQAGRESLVDSEKREIAKELNEAVVEVLVNKTMKAVDETGYENVWLAGGVAANKLLRIKLETKCEEAGVKLWMPELKYCGDNAAMIGAAAMIQMASPRSNANEILSIKAEPGMGI